MVWHLPGTWAMFTCVLVLKTGRYLQFTEFLQMFLQLVYIRTAPRLEVP